MQALCRRGKRLAVTLENQGLIAEAGRTMHDMSGRRFPPPPAIGSPSIGRGKGCLLGKGLDHAWLTIRHRDTETGICRGLPHLGWSIALCRLKPEWRQPSSLRITVSSIRRSRRSIRSARWRKRCSRLQRCIFRKGHEALHRPGAAIGHQGVQVRVEVDQVPIGLDDHDDAWGGGRLLARCPKERLQGVGGTLAEVPEEPAVPAEVHPEHRRDGEDLLAMGDRG